MFESAINPVLTTIGPFEIRYYGILLASAFVVGYFLLRKLGKEKGLTGDQIDEFFIWFIPLVLICARLFHVIFYDPIYFFTHPLEILAFWKGGIASHGGIIGGVLAIVIFCRKYKIKFYDFADLVVIPFALGAVFIRIGNFFNGELVGRVSDVPWAVKFPDYEGFRHPSQIYESIKNFVLFLILYNMRRIKDLPSGVIFWSSIGIFSFFRFFVEFYKEFPLFFGLNIGQLISLPLIVICGVMIFLRFKQHKKKKRPKK
ncbi:prolipoprotein diacylglyceryl transferase [Nanoarchaeota archaeon]